MGRRGRIICVQQASMALRSSSSSSKARMIFPIQGPRRVRPFFVVFVALALTTMLTYSGVRPLVRPYYFTIPHEDLSSKKDISSVGKEKRQKQGDHSIVSVDEAKNDACSRTSTSRRHQSLSLTQLAKNDCLVSFLIAGMRKGGTTSLYQYIAQHPQVLGVKLDAGPQAGEMFYSFGTELSDKPAEQIRTKYNQKVMDELKRLHPTNMLNVPNMIVGESTVAYGPSCTAPQNVYRSCGECMKVIFLVRNPIARMESLYRMRKGLNPEMPSPTLQHFAQFNLREYEKRVSNNISTPWPNATSSVCLWDQDFYNAIWGGLYTIHLNRWLQYYGKEQILVLKSEDMVRDGKTVLQRVLEFLNLDPKQMDIEDVVRSKYNAAPPKKNNDEEGEVISGELRKRLQTIFQPFNDQLQVQFGIDTRDWY